MASVEIHNNAELERLMTTHPEMQKALQQAIKRVIKMARNSTASGIASYIENNKRNGNQAVRSSNYKAILGGQVNLYNARKRGSVRAYVPPQRFLHDTVLNSKGNHRGGNRMKRSAKTTRAMSYAGMDLAYVMRWLSSGTAARVSHGGNRGLITGKHFFASIARRSLETAAAVLLEEMEKIINTRK